MDLSDIRLVETIINAGSISKASEALNMSQPTLSRKLARIEHEIRASLFHRSPKGLIPTTIANYMVAEAENLQSQIRGIKRHVELMTQLETGRIKLGVGPIIEQLLLPDVLSRFVDDTGDIQIMIVTEDNETLMRLFESSELDIVIGPLSEEQSSSNVISIPMISNKIVAVARTGHPLFDLEKLTHAELRNYQLVIPKSQGTIHGPKQGSLLRRPKIRFDNYSLLKKLACDTDVVCAGPMAIFKEEINEKRLKIIELDLKTIWTSALLVREESLASPLVSHFIELCKAVVAEQK